MFDSCYINVILNYCKYIVTGLILLIGLIRFIMISNSSKAIKTFIKYLFIGILLFFLLHFGQSFMKNSCSSYNDEDSSIIEEDSESVITTISEDESEEEISIETIDGVTYVNGYLIVNKTYGLPSDYRPSNSYGYDRCNSCLTAETLNAFNLMKADATVLGLDLYISSGFRSYSYQNTIYNNYVSRDGRVLADTYSARPGHSEHQTGLAFDLNTIDDSFANTLEGKWVYDNCYKYGLILRYPKGKEDQTGYQYESWHLRYVGIELAKELYNDGNWITLEEYFNLTSSYE